MSKFIEDLYYGEVNPQFKEKDYPKCIGKALKEMNEKEDKLTSCLKGDNLKLFLDYVNSSSELFGFIGEDNYVKGFKDGAHFTYDTFCDS